jgi:hypothetical protein
MIDRRCHDCGGSLAAGEGWIVPPDYPSIDPLLTALAQVPVCDRCLLARCGRGVTDRTLPTSSDT